MFEYFKITKKKEDKKEIKICVCVYVIISVFLLCIAW